MKNQTISHQEKETKIQTLIREASTKDSTADAWRARLDEWIDLNRAVVSERENLLVALFNR